MNIVNKKKVILIAVILLVLGSCLYIGYNVFLNKYFETVFQQEETVKSDDGNYEYIQLSSPKGRLCTLFIIKKELNGQGSLIKTEIVFNNNDVKQISWGINSNDLFFDSKEKGVYYYRCDNDEWIGELYFDIEKTKSEFLKGNKDVYYFSGYREVTDKYGELDFGRISGQVYKNNIPENFLSILDAEL